MDRVVIGAVREHAPMPEVLKVGADSKPKAVAGALAAVLRERGSVELQAGGGGGGDQAGKGVALTPGFLAPQRLHNLAISPLPQGIVYGEGKKATTVLGPGPL